MSADSSSALPHKSDGEKTLHEIEPEPGEPPFKAGASLSINLEAERTKVSAGSEDDDDDDDDPIQSFEGPEKVLEVWWKPLAPSSEYKTGHGHNYGHDGPVAPEESDLNAMQGDDKLGRHPNRKHHEPAGTPDGKSGKPDGLPTGSGAPADNPASGVGSPVLGGMAGPGSHKHAKHHKKRQFAPAAPSVGVGLRSVPRVQWEEMLDLVHCQILSVSSNEHLDAYVLSESSLFVYPNRVLLKTCGTTTLLACIDKLLEIAKSVGLVEIEDAFYSRKSFLYPDKQLHPHSSFKEECKVLDRYFDGSGYQLGKTNGEHWFLYITDKSASVESTSTADQTLEILMTGLDQKIMRQFFYQQGNKDFVSARHSTMASGIGDLLPGAILDDYAFDPCGYSMNGLIGEAYFTIHITPQPQCSYASFETNASHEDFKELVEKVVTVFKPSNFVVTLFANLHTAPAIHSSFPSELAGCKKTTKMLYEFENNYKLSFCHYMAPGHDLKGSRFLPVTSSPKSDEDDTLTPTA